ncbi:nuclear transport factor 2 family protein [Haladaptatus salinisoli]|uniref:nuclear transport factor 2 family protein n=1 Tax=Haladaptatus salinisoli TaxID=2884876 RepID=UPI001D09A781|nr:nuclear transport factor 2 family protein [Haladaptatus salinisoli]
MGAEETVRDYYEALRRGEPLHPFFAAREDVVKFGISERLTGYDEIAAGLREQTDTTADWSVGSERLRVVEGREFARFSDDVRLAWADARTGRRRAFDTRWSGVLERDEDEWVFTGMHVSVAREL